MPGAPEFQWLGHTFKGYQIDHIKKRLNSWLQPQQTVTLEVSIEALAYTVSTTQSCHGESTATGCQNQRSATLSLLPPSYTSLSISFMYSTQPGSAEYLPADCSTLLF